MRRLVVVAALLVALAPAVWAGGIPNGGHVYLNCENFQIGGNGNFLGTAGKTIDGSGNCIVTFPGTGPLGDFATARFWMPHSALAGAATWGTSPVGTINSTVQSNNICLVSRIECSISGSNISMNNGGDAPNGVTDLLSPAGTANVEIGGGPGTGYADVNPWDQANSAVCGLTASCNDYPCVLRMTRINCNGSDPATFNMYGVDVAFPTL